MVTLYPIQLAELADLQAWMSLVRLVRDHFPGLETEEQLEAHRQTVIKNIQRGTAICAHCGPDLVGGLLFSLRQGCLSWMAVHPRHRRQGIGEGLVEKMLSCFPADAEIWVSTFREGDEKAPAPRALYRKLGFVEGELGEEFGHPSQKFILRRG